MRSTKIIKICSSSLCTCLHHMVILRARNKITDFFMILAWASPFKCQLNSKNGFIPLVLDVWPKCGPSAVRWGGGGPTTPPPTPPPPPWLRAWTPYMAIFGNMHDMHNARYVMYIEGVKCVEVKNILAGFIIVFMS